MKTAPDICSSFSLTETLPSMENQHCHKHVSPESEGKVQNKTGEESLVTQKKDRPMWKHQHPKEWRIRPFKLAEVLEDSSH